VTDQIDQWRQGVSESLGDIKANIKHLVDSRGKDDERITHLEIKQSRRDGVMAVLVLVLPLIPFLPDFFKKLFTG
jgi:hypothetical protein